MANDVIDVIEQTQRKPWNTPMVIVAEMEDTAAKGFTIGDGSYGGGQLSVPEDDTNGSPHLSLISVYSWFLSMRTLF